MIIKSERISLKHLLTVEALTDQSYGLDSQRARIQARG